MESTLPFVFDRQAAAMVPDLSAVRAWGGAQHVFVSSLITDLRAERAAVRLAIQEVGAVPVMFEHDLGAQDVPAERAYLDGVRQSGIYVGIFGPRYGVRLASGRSATHDELVEAEHLGLRLCVFTSGSGADAMDGDQRDVVDGLRNLYTTSGYSSPEELHERVKQRLTDIAAEEILPWVRLGQVFIRASTITTSGETVAITTTIYDRSIFAELKQMEDRRQVVPFASHLDAFDAQIQQVASTVTTAATTEVAITLSRRQAQGSLSMQRMTVNGLSADELVKRSLSDGMFGTTLLPQDRFMSLSRPVNPLAPLVGIGLSERSIRPLAQVLLAEFLIRNQHASSLEPVILGPDHQGARQLKLTWLPSRPHANSPAPTQITIEGAVHGL